MKKKKKGKLLKKRNAALKKENAMLKESILLAERAIEMKGTYLSHMSHDIRTSVNGIIGMTSIAVKNFDDKEKMLDCLQKADKSSRYLISLVNDILDISRIESGKMSVNHEPIDIRKVIDNCSLITEGLLVQRQVTLVREFDAILMDIRMPDMDGLSAAKTIRSLPRTDAASIPIIAMTADVYDEDVQKTVQAGMNAHLAKPIQPEQLFETLRKYYGNNAVRHKQQ